MNTAFIAFAAIFLLVASAGMLLFYRPGASRRLTAAISPSYETKEAGDRRSFGDPLKAAVRPLDKLLPKTERETSIVRTRLIRAGHRNESDVRLFYGAKVLTPLVLCALAFAFNLNRYLDWFILCPVALAIGYLIPDFWLGNRIAARQSEIRVGLPELLDLMVVCIEAGLSLDQALSRSIEELQKNQSAIADEFGLVLLEQRAGRPRLEAWRHLADRVDVDILRTLVSAITQSEQFGTSVSKSLRTYSDTLRVQRRQKIEELAAKTGVKLVFPLVLFIFPSLFVVALGPAVISLLDSFKKYF